MIFADKLINERKKNGWSQEELAEKLSVSRQSVSKWEGAQSVPDLQKVVQMAEIFGVSIDYLLKDEIEAVPASDALREDAQSASPLRRVSMEEAQRYMENERSNAPRTALGVALCILSPVVLLLLLGLSEAGRFGITEGFASGVGVGVLLLMVASAVAVFILCGAKSREFEYIQKESFETAYGVTGIVRERREAFAGKHLRMVTLGVVLCILSALPLVVTASLGAGDAVILAMVALLLALVAAAVYLFVYAGIIKNSYDALLQENDFSAAEKDAARRLDPLSGIYWGLTTAVYLAVSFITGRWETTWIVWPIAGVLFGVVIAAAKAITGRKSD